MKNLCETSFLKLLQKRKKEDLLLSSYNKNLKNIGKTEYPLSYSVFCFFENRYRQTWISWLKICKKLKSGYNYLDLYQ